MTVTVLALILFTVLLSASAQLVLKLGVTNTHLEVALRTDLITAMLAAASSPFIWLGLIIYGLSVGLWIWVLSKVDLSVAYPFVGLGFVVTMLFGMFFLHETVTPIRAVGTICIVVGCVLVGKSA
ncbi:MAG: SMR family transporter [Proteobacteria bacterium]|nr:SMR family transporter [Pseudomonadota bacterium]